MGKSGKIKTTAVGGPVRLMDDGAELGPVARGPSQRGNDFDIRMSEEADGVAAAQKIVEVLKKRGVCVIEANAPAELILAAHEEATELWEDGQFSPPIKVHSDSSMAEARLYDSAWGGERKVHWLRPQGSEGDSKYLKTALTLLSNNMKDFGAGLGDFLKREMGIQFDRHGHTMLSCYTGDREHSLHIDNPHACDLDGKVPDTGMRLSCAYYINPHWDNYSDAHPGGMDVHLTDASAPPESATAARGSPRLRVAPHADSLVLFLSERMAHRVLSTSGTETWFCMNMWFMDGKIVEQIPRKLADMRQQGADAESDGSA